MQSTTKRLLATGAFLALSGASYVAWKNFRPEPFIVSLLRKNLSAPSGIDNDVIQYSADLSFNVNDERTQAKILFVDPGTSDPSSNGARFSIRKGQDYKRPGLLDDELQKVCKQAGLSSERANMACLLSAMEVISWGPERVTGATIDSRRGQLR